MSIFGVTACPECESNLSPDGSDDDRPVQTVDQSCSSCDYSTKLGLLWYGNRGYEIVADVSDVPSEKKEPCDKSGGDSTTVVIPMETDVPIYYSESETRSHHQETINLIHE